MRLLELKDKYPLIGDVRGKGLMIGIELVKDRKEPAVNEISRLFENTKKRGLLIGKGGLYGNVVRISPPMTADKPAIDEAVEILNEAFTDLS
jgi:4-aminobutyrate aminotransferase-like enzyme